jgi:hypothetical protein
MGANEETALPIAANTNRYNNVYVKQYAITQQFTQKSNYIIQAQLTTIRLSHNVQKKVKNNTYKLIIPNFFEGSNKIHSTAVPPYSRVICSKTYR